MGNDKIIEVESIVKFRSLLNIGFYLGLDQTFIILSFRWNLVSIFVLDKFNYSCSFKDRKLSLFLDSKLVETDSLSSYDNFYSINIFYFI